METTRRRGGVNILGATLGLFAMLEAQAGCPQWTWGVGLTRIAPHTTSGPITVVSIGGQPVDVPVADSGVKGSNENTLLLLVECEYTASWKYRFVAGIPPTHRLIGTGSLAGFGTLGEGRQWSPAVLAIHTFLDPSLAVRPFVGGGINYTWFDRARISNDAFRTASFGPDATTEVSLKSSFNPVATAGIALRFDERWRAEFSLSYLPLKTRITVRAENTASGAPVTSVTDIRNRTMLGSITINSHWN